jgi:hypothetical protein
MATYVLPFPLRHRYNGMVGALDYPAGAPGTLTVALASHWLHCSLVIVPHFLKPLFWVT